MVRFHPLALGGLDNSTRWSRQNIQVPRYQSPFNKKDHKMSCECRLCQRTRQFRDAIGRVPEQDKKFWEETFEALFNVEFDRDYYQAIVNGSWPNSDKVIHDHRSAKQSTVKEGKDNE
jgi:hypothetical protein